jgi:ribosomal protein L11 methyltransferase
MKDSFVEVEIAADEGLLENLAAILGQLGFEGFWEEDRILRGYLSASRWDGRLEEEVRSVAALLARSSASMAPRITVREIEPRNWNEEWEKTIQPIRVTDRIVIAPTWHAVEPGGDDIVLRIDPKMSFGTGYHETTRLVLHLLQRRVRDGITVLDVGTGTGVLAIAAVRLGASSATGVDVDEWSYVNARENLRLNGVEEKIRVLRGDLAVVPPGTYDLVLANIQLNVIEPLLRSLGERLAPGGTLILSGLLLADEERISDALDEAGLTTVELRSENEWIALAAVTRHPRP